MSKRSASKLDSLDDVRALREALIELGNIWADFESESNLLMIVDYVKHLSTRNFRAGSVIEALSNVAQMIAEIRGFPDQACEAKTLLKAFNAALERAPKEFDPIPQIGVPPPGSGNGAIQACRILTDPTLGGPLPFRPSFALQTLQTLFTIPASIVAATEMVAFTVPRLTDIQLAAGVPPLVDPEWILVRAQERPSVFRNRALDTVPVMQVQYPHGWDETMKSYKVANDRILPTLSPDRAVYYYFKVGEPCLALFPDTSSFYKATIVEEAGFDNKWCYSVAFEDDVIEHRPIYSRFVVPLLIEVDGTFVLSSEYPADEPGPSLDEVKARMTAAGLSTEP
ncbi:SGF29 tudor-like domain [Carpediemonas membranifera]|uniref:SGF29 tudor-like domain n=1 Tax=Carpediemonas membranifera TaxID=201153 RepID=A0A8J6B9C3_9EUKA|nr:SGF29 tudor-like domain [Carpediemonas membranifera]|eukprot:KAG9396904.1 SGF29 tudor-like domain [Carpediemonas membranifera]